MENAVENKGVSGIMDGNGEGGMDIKSNVKVGTRVSAGSRSGARTGVGVWANTNVRASAKVNTKKTARNAVKAKAGKDQSTSIRATWNEVCRKQKSLMIAMLILLGLSAVLLVISLTTLHPQNTTVVVRYGDVYGELVGVTGGYERDSWANMLTFPILALVFGLVHNVLVLRVYRKYGRTTAMMVVIMTMLLVGGSILTIVRLTGEW